MTERATRLRIALVSAFPPSTGPLSEYGWHLADCVRRHERVERLYVLADRVAGASPECDAARQVIRCWSFGSATLPVRIVREITRLEVDAVWFNMHLSSSGNTKVSRFGGVVAPLVARLSGAVTLVTLHNMLGLTDLAETQLNASRLDIMGAHLGTRLLGAANLVCVPRPEYADLLRARYGVKRARFVPLGAPGAPLDSLSKAPRRGLLAFGHFGSNKRLEQLIDAVGELSEHRSDVKLTVGGSSSRYAPDYLDRLARRHRNRPYVTFLGYVPERDVPALFMGTAISVLPYGTITGMSSVALQSAMYGVPILASDILGFRALRDEGLHMSLYQWGNKDSLKEAIVRLLDLPEDQCRTMALHNLEYCREQRMEVVADEYVRALDSLIQRDHR